VELRELWLTLQRWLWLILLGIAVSSGAAYVYSRRIPPTYQASSTLLVNQGQSPSTLDYGTLVTSQRVAQTDVELIRRRPVLDVAIQQLHLPYGPDALAKKITVSVVENTNLIEITATDHDPRLVRDIANAVAQAFIDYNRQDVGEQTSQAQQTIQQQLAQVQQQIADTALKLDLAKRANSSSVDVSLLQASLNQYQSTYSGLVAAEQSLTVSEGQAVNSVRIAEPAVLPQTPIGPNTQTNVLIAAFAGLAIALVIAFVYEYLDDTVKTSEDVTAAVGLPTLAAISRSHPELTERRVITPDDRSPFTEAYRVLRTNIEFAALANPPKTLLVTSANPGEGKTTTTANLAIVMAQTGRRVVVVDADLRRPMLQQVFNCISDKGLTTLLLNHQMPAEECLQETPYPNLRVLPSGPLPPNPAELLGSEAMIGVIERLLRTCDLVIFDSSPIQAVADPAILAAKVDAVVLIADAGNTRPGVLQRAVETISRANTRILGVALNKIDTRSRSYYYSYYRHYYSGYSHAHGQNGKSGKSNGKPDGKTVVAIGANGAVGDNSHVSSHHRRSSINLGILQALDGVRDRFNRRNHG